MPSNTTKRDTSKKDRRGRRPKSIPLTLVPPSNRGSMMVTVPYSQFFYISESAASTGVVKYFRLNGPYDVDPSVASGPTFSLANWAGFYSYYRVLRAHVRAECIIQNVNGPNCVSMFPTSYSSTVPSDQNSWQVQPYAIHKTVGPLTGTTSREFNLETTYNMWDVLRVPKQTYMSEADYQSVFNSVPSKLIFLQIAMAGASSAPSTLTCRLSIGFEVLLSSPATIGA